MVMSFILQESLGWSFTNLSKNQKKVKVMMFAGKYICNGSVAVGVSKIICYSRPIKPEKYVSKGAENEKMSHKISI